MGFIDYLPHLQHNLLNVTKKRQNIHLPTIIARQFKFINLVPKVFSQNVGEKSKIADVF